MTGFPQNRSTFYRKVKDNENEDEEYDGQESGDDDDNGDEELPTSKAVKIDGRSGKYIESISIIDRYKARPDHLNDMCLGQFAISYVSTSRTPNETIFDDDGCSNEFSDQHIFEVEVDIFVFYSSCQPNFPLTIFWQKLKYNVENFNRLLFSIAGPSSCKGYG